MAPIKAITCGACQDHAIIGSLTKAVRRTALCEAENSARQRLCYTAAQNMGRLRAQESMTLQQWCFSFRGRIGRRDFWIWMGLWLALMAAAFTLANYQLVAIQSIAFFIVALLWPTAAVLVKRLHDRNKAGWWALLLIWRGCWRRGTGRCWRRSGNGASGVSFRR